MSERDVLAGGRPGTSQSWSTVHPALQRFLTRHEAADPASDPRLLVIRAPAGTGRRWFAHGWVTSAAVPTCRTGPGDAGERILVWEDAEDDHRAFFELVAAMLAGPRSGRLAVVAHPRMPVHRLALAHAGLLAEASDLLCTWEETVQFCGAEAAARAHPAVGGWLTGLETLRKDPEGHGVLQQRLRLPLLQWLGARDPDGLGAATAFLAEITERTLREFQPEVPGVVPTVSELAGLGLLHRNSAGQWFMPRVLRDVIRRGVREEDPQRAEALTDAAVLALAGSGRTEQALETALEVRSWPRVLELLQDHWVDLYTSDARVLAAFVQRLPRFVVERLDTHGLITRITAGAGPDRMVFMLPSVEPDHARDETAHRLRRKTEGLYRSPDARALLTGLLEIGHLRLSGHYRESAPAALRLRHALDTALGVHRIRPHLAAFTELQAGISLHLADRLGEARRAYEAAAYWAGRADHDYLLADASAKLALVLVHEGQPELAVGPLEEHEHRLPSVGWGQSMVARCAQMARAQRALCRLDSSSARRELAELPAAPDTDEFWSAHAAALAWEHLVAGRPREAVEFVQRLRQDRPYAAAAPLAARLLAEVERAARLATGDTSPVPGWSTDQGLANLEAVRCLRVGDRDGAARALARPERTGHRYRMVADVLGVIARSGATAGTTDHTVLQALAEAYRQDGALIDLMGLHWLGLTPALLAAGIIDDDGAARLATLGAATLAPADRPDLTEREREILDLLRQGMTRRQIAAATVRSENTIKAQLRSLYGKLEAGSAAEALERARHFGL